VVGGFYLVEIARKIEEAMAGRHGGDRKSSCNTLQVEDAGNSRDLAAASVGMSGVFYCHPFRKKLYRNQHVGPEFD